MKFINYFFLTLIILSFFSCKNKVENNTIKKFIFLGHTYRWYAAGKVDKRIEKINFSLFDKIILGGDITTTSLSDYSTLQYLDTLFDLHSENTYWTLGNHDIDNGNIDWYHKVTGRNLFYAVYTDGFTLFNLDTQLDYSLINKQFDLFSYVCDTIQNSSHLMVIMHNVVWDSVSNEFNGADFANGNYPHWTARTNPHDYFYHSMYPKLVKVQQKGVQVICISGDVGQRDVKYFSYTSPEGIQFLASGINNSVALNEEERAKLLPDYILILEYDTVLQTIKPKFYNLDEFVKNI